MSIIIERPSYRYVLESSKRLIVYGRRKTGKTFYARHVMGDTPYFYIRHGGKIISLDEDVEYDTRQFITVLKRMDEVIIDEFHRGDKLLIDLMASGEMPSKTILITSTLNYHKMLLEGRDAPLTGLFPSYKVGLLTPSELIGYGWEGDPKSIVERLIFYQEPVLIGMEIPAILYSGFGIARSLVGEALDEERYTYTRRFDAILGAVARGEITLMKITNYLRSRGLLEAGHAGAVSKYLKIMVDTGLLEAIPVWGSSSRRVYRHLSPLTHVMYYLRERYGYGDVPLSLTFLEKVVSNIVPKLIETWIERLYSEVYGYRPVKILKPAEIDVALAHGRKIKIVIEVKWGKPSRTDVLKAEEKLYRFPEAEKILVVPDKTLIPVETSLKVVDAEDLINRRF